MSELPAPHTWKAPASDHDPYCRWPSVPCACADFAAARAEARADERAQILLDGEDPSSAWHLEYLQDQANTLRAKVEALSGYPPFGDHPGAWVLRDEVLALFDGSSE